MDVLTGLLIAIGGISFLAWRDPGLMQKLIFSPYLVKERGEYYRFLTSGFIHADYIHLGFNLFVLWNFGEAMQYVFQNEFGDAWQIHFLALFLLGVIVSEIPTYLRYRTLPHYRSLGASGGVASIVFAFIFIFPLEKLYFFLIPMPAIVYGVGYLFYCTYQDKRQADHINHSAHLWGSVFGVVYLIALKPVLVLYFIEQLANWRNYFL